MIKAKAGRQGQDDVACENSFIAKGVFQRTGDLLFLSSECWFGMSTKFFATCVLVPLQSTWCGYW